MRESCKEFQKARSIKPHLQKCPGNEIPVIRPLSGHGGKVCSRCSKKNKNEQRKRENAQKRARRAKLKRDKMTAGIGPGNVVWSAPNTWTASVVDAQTLALHSPPPRRRNTFSVRSMTQARQYGLNGSISTATMAQNHVNVSQDERRVYTQSHHLFAAKTSNHLQAPENVQDKTATEMHDITSLHHRYKRESPDLPSPMLDTPLYQKQQQQQRQPVGLGISIANDDDAKQGQSHTEMCYSNEWSFLMELKEWSTVFEEGDDPDDGQEL